MGDRYDHPVIVKTDLNHGGTPEKLLGVDQDRPPSLLERVQRRLGIRNPLHMRRPADYRIYPSVSAVPRRVFREQRLVVERLLLERGGRGFIHRRYLFLGDAEVSQVWSSVHELNSGDHASRRESAASIPPALRARREELGAQFGKIDYVMVDGTPHVLDVNRTPSGWTSDPVPADAEWARETARALAPGIQSWLVDPACSRAATARSETSEERA